MNISLNTQLQSRVKMISSVDILVKCIHRHRNTYTHTISFRKWFNNCEGYRLTPVTIGCSRPRTHDGSLERARRSRSRDHPRTVTFPRARRRRRRESDTVFLGASVMTRSPTSPSSEQPKGVLENGSPGPLPDRHRPSCRRRVHSSIARHEDDTF